MQSIDTSHAKILIVDDDKAGSRFLGQRLVRQGYEVHYNFTGRNVLNDIRLINPHIVLLDIVFPEATGIEILKEVRQIYSTAQLPVIMVTSKHLTKDIVEALDAGASDFITKPAHLKVSLARIGVHIQNKILNESLVRQSSRDTVAAMIATYNHEINNPLAIAFGKIELIQRVVDNKHLDDLQSAVHRIKNIVRKITSLTEEDDLEFKEYSDSVQMIKLKAE